MKYAGVVLRVLTIVSLLKSWLMQELKIWDDVKDCARMTEEFTPGTGQWGAGGCQEQLVLSAGWRGRQLRSLPDVAEALERDHHV